MSYTEKNMKRLSKAIVNSWDMKDLVQFAVDKLVEVYEADKEAFHHDYKVHGNDLDDDETESS